MLTNNMAAYHIKKELPNYMTARTFSLPRELIAQNQQLASNDLGDILDARRPTPNASRQVTPKSKPSKKKKKSPDPNNPSITPTVFQSDGLSLAVVSSDSKEFTGGKKQSSGFQHYIDGKKINLGKVAGQYANLDRTVKIAIESRKNSTTADGGSSPKGSSLERQAGMDLM